MTPDEIADKYRDRATKILLAIRDELRARRFVPSQTPDDMSDDGDMRLTIYEGAGNDGDDMIDIQFMAMASEHWDGSKNGINFGIEATHASGRMIGGLVPFNYSDQVWVDRGDPDAIEERFVLVEGADVGELVNLIANFRAEHAQ